MHTVTASNTIKCVQHYRPPTVLNDSVLCLGYAISAYIQMLIAIKNGTYLHLKVVFSAYLNWSIFVGILVSVRGNKALCHRKTSDAGCFRDKFPCFLGIVVSCSFSPLINAHKRLQSPECCVSINVTGHVPVHHPLSSSAVKLTHQSVDAVNVVLADWSHQRSLLSLALSNL